MTGMHYWISLLAISLLVYGCKSDIDKGNTTEINSFVGVYEFGFESESSGGAQIIISSENNSSFLFFLSVNRGAPSYNSGSLYGRMNIEDRTAVFEKENCEWTAHFSESSVQISTVSDQYECGFGHGVIVDGTYRKKTGDPPLYFENYGGREDLL